MSRHFNGSWKPVKKDPPDFFLTIEERQIAVEVTGIFEQVPISKTKRQPRHTMDSAVVAMCDRLNRSLKTHVPIGTVMDRHSLWFVSGIKRVLVVHGFLFG